MLIRCEEHSKDRIRREAGADGLLLVPSAGCGECSDACGSEAEHDRGCAEADTEGADIEPCIASRTVKDQPPGQRPQSHARLDAMEPAPTIVPMIGNGKFSRMSAA